MKLNEKEKIVFDCIKQVLKTTDLKSQPEIKEFYNSITNSIDKGEDFGSFDFEKDNYKLFKTLSTELLSKIYLVEDSTDPKNKMNYTIAQSIFFQNILILVEKIIFEITSKIDPKIKKQYEELNKDFWKNNPLEELYYKRIFREYQLEILIYQMLKEFGLDKKTFLLKSGDKKTTWIEFILKIPTNPEIIRRLNHDEKIIFEELIELLKKELPSLSISPVIDDINNLIKSIDSLNIKRTHNLSN
ncbi:MAG: hypothetical protein ACRC4M_01065 [Mycoplasma sp.]